MGQLILHLCASADDSIHDINTRLKAKQQQIKQPRLS